MNKQRFWHRRRSPRSCSAAIGAAPASAETIVTMNTVQIFGTIDPAKISDYTDYMAAVNLYDGLVSVDAKGNLIPELAESWTVSDDAKEVTFKMRADAKFADGTPVQASDVDLFGRAAAAHQPGSGQSVRRRAEARLGDRARCQDGEVHAVEDLRAVPDHRARHLHRQREAGEGQRGLATTARPISRPTSPAPAPMR